MVFTPFVQSEFVPFSKLEQIQTNNHKDDIDQLGANTLEHAY